jgi:hypothetical protein
LAPLPPCLPLVVLGFMPMGLAGRDHPVLYL